jgi:spoIIIJ-associated protein
VAEAEVEEIERSAASVEEAIEAALAELGISEQEAHIEIVQEPRGGFLGLNPKGAVVRVRPAPAAPSGEEREEQAGAAAGFLRGLLEAMELDAEVEFQTAGDLTYVDVWGADDDEDMGLLIGKGGHTLDALQELVRGTVLRVTGGRCLVQVDVEDYRKRQRSRIVGKAREVARRVRKTGRQEAMDPMSAFERKIVHDAVAEVGGLETASEGEEPNRRVVIRRAGR